ncbi:hypothetical protein [Sinorhizobium meliloti]|uniref:hypothetical protein n=1 Tax=Rhizobium meliloti TaxID=382 RepID=UPI000FD8D5F4|nr:hypothetical protein [Sinorhizobium meliloti]RVI58539.1 hypothetical protein CN189_26195 [Sinorhizobium meliloti]
MKKIVLTAIAAALPAGVFANEIDDAMKRIGPAYMCGPTHEYREALDALNKALLSAGVPDMLAQYAIAGVSGYVKKEHAKKRETITAKECSEVYGRS